MASFGIRRSLSGAGSRVSRAPPKEKSRQKLHRRLESALAVRAATGVESRIFCDACGTGSLGAAVTTVILLPHGLPGSLVVVLVILGRTKDDFACCALFMVIGIGFGGPHE
jgi:hypothetical protein